MGFWPFGRDPEVESASRVVTAQVHNGVRVRAKLLLHFLEPLERHAADEAADHCAAIASALLREAPDHGSLVGAEARLSGELGARYPSSSPKVRVIELAGLHVVGDPALSGELRRASSPNMTPVPFPATTSSYPPPPSIRRRASSQMRALSTILLPPGTAPAVMGQFIAPGVKDAAARLLVGYLRAHDLVGVRKAAIDENSAEMLATLVPASDAPPGGYEASRAGELGRWQTTLGEPCLGALAREARVATVYLARQSLALVEVMPTLADAVVAGVCDTAFPDDAGLASDVARLPKPVPADFLGHLAARLTEIASAGDDPSAIASAMAPLLADVQEDLKVSAMIIKASAGV